MIEGPSGGQVNLLAGHGRLDEAGGRYVPLLFDRFCDEHDIKHRLTKIKHPWTNGQGERMNRTIKEATAKPTTTTATPS